jgi:hypothetical protein
MLETRILPAAVAAVALLAPVNVLLAQYNGPPIIIQTPQFPQPSMTNNLKPLTGTTLPAAAPTAAAAPAAVAAPAAAARAQPCVANTKC